MLFNSLEFALFLPLVFLLYWLAAQRDLRVQNGMLLIASYVFYGWWDWRFLSLIAISSAVDFLVGLNLGRQNSPARRRLILLASIIVNLGFLGFFKYFNFFAESFADAFTLFGRSFTPARLKIILPVGISFYTFQTVSYTIDVYRRETEPTRDVIAFFAFVAFFPQLVAGPIERARNLLPQFTRSRTFEYHKAADGMRQIIWGLFKKVVIADNCASAGPGLRLSLAPPRPGCRPHSCVSPISSKTSTVTRATARRCSAAQNLLATDGHTCILTA